MLYIHQQNRISYDKQIRDMNASQLEREYYKIILNGNIPASSYHLSIIRKCYRQITGEDIQTIISKTA